MNEVEFKQLCAAVGDDGNRGMTAKGVATMFEKEPPGVQATTMKPSVASFVWV